MKAILVIDEMPKSCYKCPMMFDDGNGLWCGVERDKDGDMHMRVHYYCGENGRAGWCPLKSLPQTKNTDFSPNIVYANGWNDCLEEITK